MKSTDQNFNILEQQLRKLLASPSIPATSPIDLPSSAGIGPTAPGRVRARTCLQQVLHVNEQCVPWEVFSQVLVAYLWYPVCRILQQRAHLMAILVAFKSRTWESPAGRKLARSSPTRQTRVVVEVTTTAMTRTQTLIAKTLILLHAMSKREDVDKHDGA